MKSNAKTRLVCLLCLVYVLGSCTNARAGLVVHWKLDDGQGKIAKDSSGNGHDGVFSNSGAPTWVAGKLGGALQFHGGGEHVQYSFPEEAWPACTVAVWVKVTTLGQAGYSVVFSNHTPNSAGFQIDVNGGNPGSYRIHPSSLLFGTVQTDWVHLAMTSVGTAVKLYYNGSYVTSGTLTDMLFNKFALAVARSGTSGYLACTIDDLRVYDNALSAAEIQNVMNGVVALPAAAAEPSPADQATDVPCDPVLGWKPGPFAATHDVYFGTSFADVNTASRQSPQGVLVGQDRTEATYTPAGLLAFGQTYYWRVDEVNAAPDNTIFKGSVWSFTAEPYSYPVKPVAATASSAQAGMGPEKTIDGSGLTGDLHGTDLTTMWLSAGGLPNWIQYEFGQAYKLREMQVWNSNQLIEGLLGFGAKTVTVETSLDGTTWTPLADVPEFRKAPGTPGYAADTVVNLGDAEAKYVRLTINATWSGGSTASLSEVRFSYVPVQARVPQPATGATGVDVDPVLNWRPGREAASHQVFFGTDPNALATGATVTEHNYTPGPLDYGTEYYWRVDEAGTAATYPGAVWNFSTREYETIDDFESYDDTANVIFDTWLDNYDPQGDQSGSLVGNEKAPYAERTMVHSGKQSMPLAYNNAGPKYLYSETVREFDSAQNWTVRGADTLSLWVRGRPVAYAENAGTITLSGSGHDIWDAADDFRFACQTLNGNGSIVVKVESLINTNAWAKAGVMIRQSLDADSKFAYMIVSASSGVSFGYRQAIATTPGSVTQAGVTAPQWVKLTRTGDAFTAQYSADGKTWLDIKNADGTVAAPAVTMTGPVYIGLCVTSHNAAATTVAVMSGAAATGNLTGPQWQVVEIGDDPEPANSPAALYVAIQDNAGKTALVANSTAVTSTSWTQWQIPLSSFTGVNLSKVKKLYLGVGDRANPTKGGAGLLYIDDLAFGHPVSAK